VHAIRATYAYDGESFRSAGATVLIEGGVIVGVERYGFRVPDQCRVTSYDGTLLPGRIDAHTHLVTDSGVSALDRVAGYSDQEIDEVGLPVTAHAHGTPAVEQAIVRICIGLCRTAMPAAVRR
jgi:imidazolonepropionase-like amidohydrolase